MSFVMTIWSGFKEYREGKAQGSGANKTYDGGSGYKASTVKERFTQQKYEDVTPIHEYSDWSQCWANPDICFPESSNVTYSHIEALQRKVLTNTFFIRHHGRNGTVTARAMGIVQHTAVVPYHYVEHFTNLLKVDEGCLDIVTSDRVIIACGNDIFDSVERIKDMKGNNTGLCTMQVPNNMAMFKKIDDKFIGTQTEFPGQCLLMSLILGPKLDVYRECTTLSLGRLQSQEVAAGRFSNGWKISSAFTYPKQSPGLCGSVIVGVFKDGPVILGMHTAGLVNKGEGLSEPLFNKYFNQVIIKDKPVMCERFVNFDVLEPEVAKQQLDTNVTKLFTLPKNKIPRQAEKSKIIPSLIQGVYPVTSEPMPLTAKDPRLDKNLHEFGFINPLFCGSRKRGMIPILFDPEIVKVCKLSLSKKICEVVLPLRNEIGKLSVKQSVNGITSLEGYDRMDLSTSEGYPWVLSRPKTAGDKSWLFQVKDDEIVGIDPVLLNRVVRTNKSREAGIVPFILYQNTLKDERKPKAKAKIPGKTRVFEMSPVDATISHRMYTQDFVAAYMKTRLDAEHAIGINPDGPEWTFLYNKLINHSKYILVGDYSGFGPTIHYSCISSAFEIISDWYDMYGSVDEKGRLARNCMSDEIGKSRCVCADMVYQAHCGLPSGCSLTVYLNSLVNCLYVRYVFYVLNERNGSKYTIEDFDKLVMLVVYGDDVIMSVASEIINWFNNESISECFAEYKIKYTDVTKEGKIRKYCSIEEASFLKRGFKLYQQRMRSYKNRQVVLAPLEFNVVTDTANWMHVSEDPHMSTLETSEASVRNMFGHGPDAFNKHRRKITSALKDKNVRGSIRSVPPWDEMLKQAHPVEECPTIKHF